ncbi:MAG: PepSY domain-containing protein [Peptococcaceae bacterium]|nr:PepSY domain-containing protein [Peptococcaceae bacterium]
MTKLNKIRSFTGILLGLVLILLLAVGLTIAKQPVYGTPNSSHNLFQLKEAGISLVTPKSPPSISKNQAISIAKKQLGPQTKNAKSITAEYWAVLNNSFKGFSAVALAKNPKLQNNAQNAVPIWIVSFRGLSIAPRGGRPGLKYPSNAYHTELNVFIDANTGEPLYTLSYR